VTLQCAMRARLSPTLLFRSNYMQSAGSPLYSVDRKGMCNAADFFSIEDTP